MIFTLNPLEEIEGMKRRGMPITPLFTPLLFFAPFVRQKNGYSNTHKTYTNNIHNTTGIEAGPCCFLKLAFFLWVQQSTYLVACVGCLVFTGSQSFKTRWGEGESESKRRYYNNTQDTKDPKVGQKEMSETKKST